ncbi:GNAT family N-acetyltransferase [Paenibacillus sp. NEAU-GSW1]|uniref:GNAT family N-acetyltransferase n=1 Tax=Paenibacillus sp. NEAU-GSW1 TaxID=2682486 RepID=UPI0012E173EE|nr:GNAT family N-acetyltransferase [Paenibacillus sp. NEAU-GSW1]MUT65914.1 GNAT family N-acetyltransferase [Paenibacillus sp. NEAU-GSW1]
MLVGQYRIELLDSVDFAERITQFLLSEHSFDDTRYTPGELAHFRELPHRALAGEHVLWYALNEAGEVIAVNSVTENEQQTGGYSWDYIVVHRSCRKSGLATAIIDEMLAFLMLIRSRYIITYTCDLPEYAAIRRLFERNGFSLVGRCPDYYYDGEDRLIYYRKLEYGKPNEEK